MASHPLPIEVRPCIRRPAPLRGFCGSDTVIVSLSRPVLSTYSASRSPYGDCPAGLVCHHFWPKAACPKWWQTNEPILMSRVDKPVYKRTYLLLKPLLRGAGSLSPFTARNELIRAHSSSTSLRFGLPPASYLYSLLGASDSSNFPAPNGVYYKIRTCFPYCLVVALSPCLPRSDNLET